MLTQDQLESYASQVAKLLRKPEPANTIALWVTQRAFEEELTPTGADAMNLALFSVPEIAEVLKQALAGTMIALMNNDLQAYALEVMQSADFYRELAYQIGVLQRPD